MISKTFTLQLLLATFARWVNCHQTQAIEHLVEENRVLKEQLGNELIRSTPTNDSTTGDVVESERLGGLLRSYHRTA